MDNNLRQISSIPESDFYKVNEKGQLTGILGEKYNSLIEFFTKKFNGTYVVLRNGESPKNALGSDRGDFVIYPFEEFSTGPNTTAGTALETRSCLILTRPPIKFSSDSHGLETALFSTKLHLAIIILFLWSLLLTIIFCRYLKRERSNIVWMLICTLFKQLGNYPRHAPMKIIFWTLLLSSYLLQIMYGSFMNTERATLTSYDKIDTLEDMDQKGLTGFQSSISRSPAERPFKRKTPYDLMSPPPLVPENHPNNIHICMISGRCAILINSFEWTGVLSAACSIYPDSVIAHPFQISKPFESVLIGVMMNTNVPKQKLNRLARYFYLITEMGVYAKQCVNFRNVMSKIIPQPPKRECLEKKIESQVSSSEPIGIEFYGRVLILYLVITVLAIGLRLIQCVFSMGSISVGFSWLGKSLSHLTRISKCV